MPSGIRQVAVISAGRLGGLLAAHIAKTDVPVLWLDTTPDEGDAERRLRAEEALADVQNDEPSTLTSSGKVGLINKGKLQGSLGRLYDADWIIDTLPEDFPAREELYRKIDIYRRRGTIFSYNGALTSFKALVGNQSDAFAEDFLVTNFFGLAKGARLVEMAMGPKTRRDAADLVGDFCDRYLGNGIVICRDAPGLAAFRLGLFFMRAAQAAARDLFLSHEEVNEILETSMGLNEGISGIQKRLGGNQAKLLADRLMSLLSPNDPLHTVSRPEMIGKDLLKLRETPDKLGPFTWRILSETLIYACRLIPHVVANIAALDRAVSLGLGWRVGPFEWADELGSDWVVQRLTTENRHVPFLLANASDKPFYRADDRRRLVGLTLDDIYAPVIRPPGVLLMADVKRSRQPVEKNDSAALWDIGDRVLCLEMAAKDNVINNDVLRMLSRAKVRIGDGRGEWKGLVLWSAAEDFSRGIDPAALSFSARSAKRTQIETYAFKGQLVCKALRFAPFPSVAAVAGAAIGGGCEIVLHCSGVQAHTDAVFSLADPDLKLIPAWGGCAQLLGRAFNAQKYLGKPAANYAFGLLRAAEKVAAKDAKDKLYMGPADGLTANRDRLLHDAKQRVLDMAKEYRKPEAWRIHLPGYAGRSALELEIENFKHRHKASAHDVIVWKALASVLCGSKDYNFTGAVSEEKIMEFERREFVRVVQLPETRARLEERFEVDESDEAMLRELQPALLRRR